MQHFLHHCHSHPTSWLIKKCPTHEFPWPLMSCELRVSSVLLALHSFPPVSAHSSPFFSRPIVAAPIATSRNTQHCTVKPNPTSHIFKDQLITSNPWYHLCGSFHFDPPGPSSHESSWVFLKAGHKSHMLKFTPKNGLMIFQGPLLPWWLYHVLFFF